MISFRHLVAVCSLYKRLSCFVLLFVQELAGIHCEDIDEKLLPAPEERVSEPFRESKSRS